MWEQQRQSQLLVNLSGGGGGRGLGVRSEVGAAAGAAVAQGRLSITPPRSLQIYFSTWVRKDRP